MDESTDSITVSAGHPDDAPELAAISRELLPSYTHLHDENRWGHRFGQGESAERPGLWVLRENNERVVGFVWTDRAMFVDAQIIEPWWCINALAVHPDHEGNGHGSSLLDKVNAAGREVGVALLYGLALPDSVSFWAHKGYTMAKEHEGLKTSSAPRRPPHPPQTIVFKPTSGQRFFVKYLATEPGSVSCGLVPESW